MISVIVPVYNGAKTISACLESILNQTEPDLEILVIDDGSTDATACLCRKKAAKDSRLRLFSQKKAGVSAARNRGLREAKGEYLTFVDADDLLPSVALETLMRAMEEGVDFVIGSHVYFRGLWKKKSIHSSDEDIRKLVSLMCGKLYRRSILNAGNLRFREELPYGEDTVFNLQYGSCAKSWKVLPDIIYHCRMGGSASSLRYYPNRDAIALELVEAYREHVSPSQLQAIAEGELTETMLHYLVHCTGGDARKKTEEAKKLLFPYLIDSSITMESVRKAYWHRILLRKLKKWLRGYGI